MTTTTTLINPLNGQRQVGPGSSIVVSISSTEILNLDTLNIRLNGISAVSAGAFSSIDEYLTEDAYVATRTVIATTTSSLNPGEQIQISDAYTSFTNTVMSATTRSATKAQLTTNFPNSNSNLVFIAKVAGSSGNSISIEYKFDPLTQADYLNLSKPLPANPSIVSTSNSISVVIRAPYPTAKEVLTSTLGDLTARTLVDVIEVANTNATGAVLLYPQTSLTGGTNGSTILGLKDAVSNLTTSNLAKIKSIDRSYTGTIVATNSNKNIAITIDPLGLLPSNKIVIITTEIVDAYSSTSRAAFSFRTADLLPPQLFDFPTTMRESELSFRLVDILQSAIPLESLNIYIEDQPAVVAGTIAYEYVGTINSTLPSELIIFLRPKRKYRDNQEISVDIHTSDGYGNSISYSKKILNKTTPLQIELLSIFPREDTVLDPIFHPIEIRMRTNFNLARRFINASYQLGEVTNSGVIRGVVVPVESGALKVINRDIILNLDNLRDLKFNSKMELMIFMQEVTPQKIDFIFFQNLNGLWFDTPVAKYLEISIGNKTSTVWLNVLVKDPITNIVITDTIVQLPPSLPNLIQVDINPSDSPLTIVAKIARELKTSLPEIDATFHLDQINQDALLTLEARDPDTNINGDAKTTGATSIYSEGDPIGTPFFVRSFNYTTVHSELGPLIDTFSPKATDVVSPITSISFRAISLINKDPINISSLSVVVNNTLAIDQGTFTAQFTGNIAQVQNSNGNAVSVLFTNLNAFAIDSIVQVDISVRDLAQNLSIKSFTFPVANTSLPTIIMTPPGNTYNSAIRLKLSSSQPSQIYYTIDGSVPEVGKARTFIGTSPISNVPVFTQGVTQIKAFAVNRNGIRGPTTVEIYDLNPFRPEITISSPINGISQDITTIPVKYKINLQRGFLTKVEVSLNGAVRLDTENTLSNSSALITGLRSGTNKITIYATDNAGNEGSSEVTILVNSSTINDFALNFAPLACPRFTSRALNVKSTFNNFIDTKTVVLIGYGARREVVTEFAVGDGSDGKPKNFLASNNPDGRHFELNSFPLVLSSVRVLLTRKRREILIPSKDYVIQKDSGQIVLDHPLEIGEALVIEYISESDINNPRIYTPSDMDLLFAHHGTPSVDNVLSLAAQLAFENGAARVLAIQPLDFASDPIWSETFKRLEKEQGYWIVPVMKKSDLNMYPSIRATAFNHVLRNSQIKYRKERVLIASRLGTEPNEFNSERATLVVLDQNPKVTRVINGESQEINSTILCAALAGKASSFANIAEPLTRKAISGFTMSSTARTPALEADLLLNKGFTLIQPISGGATVYQARTSSLSLNPIQQEISVQRIIDYLSKNLRQLLETRFTGENITTNLLKTITKDTDEFLNKNSDIIKAGMTTSISIDKNDPRQINLVVSYTPLFPLNNITITFSLSTTI